jgi:hypothetical protein
MNTFVFKPQLCLPRETVRTINDATLFAQTYLGAKWPRRRRRVLTHLLAAVNRESECKAANDFRAWAEAEGLLDRRVAQRLGH